MEFLMCQETGKSTDRLKRGDEQIRYQTLDIRHLTSVVS